MFRTKDTGCKVHISSHDRIGPRIVSTLPARCTISPRISILQFLIMDCVVFKGISSHHCPLLIPRRPVVRSSVEVPRPRRCPGVIDQTNVINERPEDIPTEPYEFKEVGLGRLGQLIKTTFSQDKPVVKGAGDNEEHEENHQTEKNVYSCSQKNKH